MQRRVRGKPPRVRTYLRILSLRESNPAGSRRLLSVGGHGACRVPRDDNHFEDTALADGPSVAAGVPACRSGAQAVGQQARGPVATTAKPAAPRTTAEGNSAGFTTEFIAIWPHPMNTKPCF